MNNLAVLLMAEVMESIFRYIYNITIIATYTVQKYIILIRDLQN